MRWPSSRSSGSPCWLRFVGLERGFLRGFSLGAASLEVRNGLLSLGNLVNPPLGVVLGGLAVFLLDRLYLLGLFFGLD